MARLNKYYKPKIETKKQIVAVYPKGEKICLTCNISKPYSEYYRHAYLSVRFKPYCKDCMKKDSKDRHNSKIEQKS